MYVVYILRCADDSYYTGITNDIDKRIWQHETGYFTNCFTYKRRPVRLVWQKWIENSTEALNLEKQIKGWSRKKKAALIENDINQLKMLSNRKKEDSANTLRQAQGNVDYLIIGQGISGTWLSYYLEKENKSFLIIDNNNPKAPSRLAAGIINPVTGRRHVETWMIDELLPNTWNVYTQLGKELGIKGISQKNVVDFFPSPQMRLSFQHRVDENAPYVSMNESNSGFNNYFNYEFGYGEIVPVYTAHLETIIPAWRAYLKSKNFLLEENFDLSLLNVSAEKIEYNGITAEKIIFCDGIACSSNPYFKNLPFAGNKGEALLLDIPQLPADHIYKKGMMLVPLATPGQWWMGSAYQWDFDDIEPTAAFREKAEQILKQWLKLPYTITGHIASNRPATLERRPFVGLHPQHPSLGILNGMGTKGCSLSPFFAKQLAEHLVYNKPLIPEADVKRFAKILSR